MARLPYREKQDLAPDDQKLLVGNFNIFRAMAHSPGGLRAFNRFGTFILHKSKLDARLRELAILAVGYLARAPYEWVHHIEIGRKCGVTDADVRALMDAAEGRPSGLEPLAGAVVAAASEMTHRYAVTDATFAQLREGLDSECIVDLVLTIAYYNAVVRTLASLEVDVEDGYRRYLDEFPLPTDR
jgi:alkylhydroperoxidase family enzyme